MTNNRSLSLLLGALMAPVAFLIPLLAPVFAGVLAGLYFPVFLKLNARKGISHGFLHISGLLFALIGGFFLYTNSPLFAPFADHTPGLMAISYFLGTLFYGPGLNVHLKDLLSIQDVIKSSVLLLLLFSCTILLLNTAIPAFYFIAVVLTAFFIPHLALLVGDIRWTAQDRVLLRTNKEENEARAKALLIDSFSEKHKPKNIFFDHAQLLRNLVFIEGLATALARLGHPVDRMTPLCDVSKEFETELLKKRLSYLDFISMSVLFEESDTEPKGYLGLRQNMILLISGTEISYALLPRYWERNKKLKWECLCHIREEKMARDIPHEPSAIEGGVKPPESGHQKFRQFWTRSAREAVKFKTQRHPLNSAHDILKMHAAFDETPQTFLSGAILQKGFKIPKCRFGKQMVPLLDLDLTQINMPDMLPTFGRLQIWGAGDGRLTGNGGVECTPGSGELELYWFEDFQPGQFIPGNTTPHQIMQTTHFMHHINPEEIEDVDFYSDKLWHLQSTEGKDYEEADSIDLVSQENPELWGYEGHKKRSTIVGGWGHCARGSVSYISDILFSISFGHYDGNWDGVVNISGDKTQTRIGDFTSATYEVQI